MPRDMFGNVVKPSIAIGSRKWYTVPVSLFSHGMIVLAIVAIPILAPSAMKLPERIRAFSLDPAPPPEPPPPPRPKDTVQPKPIASNPYPIAAPTQIVDEPPPSVAPPIIMDGLIPGTISNGPPEAPPKIDKPEPDLPIRVGGLIRPPVKLGGQQPVYPPIAQSARVQGVVIIEATIGTDGHVMNAKLLRSIPLLDQAALDAVRTWTYSPTLLNGIPVAVIMTVTVQFSLQ